MAAVFLAACSLPRGAALQSEVLKEKDSDTATFQVVEVTRAAIPTINSWPATGWHGHFHWLDANGGPETAIIQPGDRVDLVIWDGQENSLLTAPTQRSVDMPGIEVSSSGNIFVPYVENVHVAGMTPAAARSLVQRRLEPVLPSAQVQLSLQEGPSNSVDLVAGTRNPGSYPIPGRSFSILSLIAAAGGIDPGLRNPQVKLMRGSETYLISAETLFENGKHNTDLRPGDKVLVEEDQRAFTALGASGTEKLIYFPTEKISAIEALSMIGGLSDSRADPRGVLVLREYPAKALRSDDTGPNLQQVIFSLDLTSADGLFAARQFTISPDDTVLATESPVTTARTIFGLFGAALGVSTQISNVSN